MLLCPSDLDASLPYATLAARLRKHVAELFTFVRDPAVDATKDHVPHCTSCSSSERASDRGRSRLCFHFSGAVAVGVS
jgi:hypothetical protein